MNNFYFYAGYSLEDNCVMVAICPEDYFDNNKCLTDYFFKVPQLPDYIKQVGESLFSSSKNIETTNNDMLRLGFISDNNFSEFCKNHDPFKNEFNSLIQEFLNIKNNIQKLFEDKEKILDDFGKVIYQHFITTGILSKYSWNTMLNYENRCSISLDVPLIKAEDLRELFANFNESSSFYLNDEVHLSFYDGDLDISFPNLNSLLENAKLFNIKIPLPDYSNHIKKLNEQIESLKQQQDYYDKIRNDQNQDQNK